MRSVEYECEKCNHIKFFTKKQSVFRFILFMILGTLLGIGIFFTTALIIVGPTNVYDSFSNGMHNNELIKAEDYVTRNLMLNITKNINCDNSYCYANVLFNNVSSIKYVPKSLTKIEYSPSYTYGNGGDCETLSEMYVKLLMSFGVKARIDCNRDENHCISIVNYKDWTKTNDYDTYLVVDLTMPIMVLMMEDEDPWDYINQTSNHTRRQQLKWEIV